VDRTHGVPLSVLVFLCDRRILGRTGEMRKCTGYAGHVPSVHWSPHDMPSLTARKVRLSE
jgi:hypothetical protein